MHYSRRYSTSDSYIFTSGTKIEIVLRSSEVPNAYIVVLTAIKLILSVRSGVLFDLKVTYH